MSQLRSARLGSPGLRAIGGAVGGPGHVRLLVLLLLLMSVLLLLLQILLLVSAHIVLLLKVHQEVRGLDVFRIRRRDALLLHLLQFLGQV